MWSKWDRVMAVFNGERPDRVPLFECMANDPVLEYWGGQPIPEGDVEGVVRACREGLDLCHPALVPQAPGRIEQADGTVQVRERWNTWTLPAQFTDDLARRRAIGDQIESAEAWDASAQRWDDAQARMATINQSAGEMVYIHLGLSCPILPFDLEQGIYAYTDYPELVGRWNQALNEKNLRDVEAQCQMPVGPVAIIWDDIAYKERLMNPPELLEKFFYPHLTRVIDLLHARHIKVLFHSDGDVSRALDDLVDCGIDGFNPLEISAGMNPTDFAGRYPRTVLVGGIDAVEVLARGTPDLVAKRTRELIDLFRPTGNLVVASASGEIGRAHV